MRSIDPTLARRLAITRQRLAGPAPDAGAGGMLELVRDLGCLQLDPIRAVERSHLLVLWSRLGAYDPTDLDRLLWQERSLFEYWAHVASIVVTEDYPIHRYLMRSYCAGDSKPTRTERMRIFLQANDDLRSHIVSEITERGALPSRYFEHKARTEWIMGGWNSGRSVTEMLDYLWTKGELMVAGRQGLQRLWDLSDRCLPEWTPRDELDEPEIVRRAAERALRALGMATPRQITEHFTRRRYPGLPQALGQLVADGRVEPVTITDGSMTWPRKWYVHADDLPLIDTLAAGDWQPRTTLLSPFDNLICDRDRTELLWDFFFRIEIYVPAPQRQYGYYVLPILHGDQLIGRIDPKMDRKSATLQVQAVHAERNAPTDAATARAVRGAIESLASFLGAKTITYGAVNGPAAWTKVLH